MSILNVSIKIDLHKLLLNIGNKTDLRRPDKFVISAEQKKLSPFRQIQQKSRKCIREKYLSSTSCESLILQRKLLLG